MTGTTRAWRLTVAVATGALLAVTAACGGSAPDSSHTDAGQAANVSAAGGMDALVAAAKKEGGLLFYCTASQDKMAAWVKDFEDQYGIKVQIYRAPTNPLYQRFSQEERVGKNKADLIEVSARGVLENAIDKGYIGKYTPANADKFPADAVVPALAYPMYLTLSAVGWNTKVVPADLQQKLASDDPLTALLDPRLKGKIAMVDVTAGGPQVASNANIVLNQADRYGWGYLEKLAKQKPVVVNSTTTVLDGVIAGDYWATLDGYTSVFAPKVVAGAPIAFRSPPTSSAAEFYLSVVAQAPHPNAARLFQEWATTLDAQDSLARVTQGDVVIDGWVDHRKIKDEPWYVAPQKLWYGWATDPTLRGDQLKAFYDRWHGTFGK